MLTGDRQDTARAIGMAVGLVDRNINSLMYTTESLNFVDLEGNLQDTVLKNQNQNQPQILAPDNSNMDFKNLGFSESLHIQEIRYNRLVEFLKLRLCEDIEEVNNR